MSQLFSANNAHVIPSTKYLIACRHELSGYPVKETRLAVIKVINY